MDAFGLAGKKVVVTGVSGRRSVAFYVGRALQEAGAEPIYVVHTEARRDELARRLDPAPIYVCDVESEASIDALAADLERDHPVLHGLVHSIAFANYEDGFKPFHKTAKRNFLQAVDISCFSLVALSEALEERFDPDASVVTISISSTHMAAENYGFMAPAKAALDSAVVFLAKSFSATSRVRFNAVKAGPLKTVSSAGIPGYVESYLYAEACTLRGSGVKTSEVADTTLFLLSPRSAGINAQGIVVDAGMAVNYFNRQVVERVAAPAPKD